MCHEVIVHKGETLVGLALKRKLESFFATYESKQRLGECVSKADMPSLPG